MRIQEYVKNLTFGERVRLKTKIGKMYRLVKSGNENKAWEVRKELEEKHGKDNLLRIMTSVFKR